MKLVKVHCRNAGDGKPIAKEKNIEEIKFYKHKFNVRKKPDDKRRILIITCFCEFGCESLALMYCIPRIIQMYPGLYVICVGWYGRQYLYKHLVDEYWELHEEFQWLRGFAQAFDPYSKNIKKLEKSLEEYGLVFKSVFMGSFCLGSTCRDCKYFFEDNEKECLCKKCGSTNIEKAIFTNIPYYKKFAVQIPRPCIKSQVLAKKYLGPNPVGIFARGRLTYGRNLRSEFYIKLIERLEKQGYTPIWLGEKASVLPCPVSHITDFSRLPESRDLELTLAIISQLEFTIQFWTASTRLASMVGTPWILMETPDQIVGNGQEGKRIDLTTDYDKRKLILSNYHDVVENEDKALDLVDLAIKQMRDYNWDDIIGLAESNVVSSMLSRQSEWRSR
jgi:hypothetical protein